MNKIEFEYILGIVGLVCFAVAISSTVIPFGPLVGDIAALVVVAVGAVYSALTPIETIGESGEIYS